MEGVKSLDSFRHQPLIFSIGQFIAEAAEIVLCDGGWQSGREFFLNTFGCAL